VDTPRYKCFQALFTSFVVIVEDVPQISLAVYVFNAPLPCFSNALEPIPRDVLTNKLIAAGAAALFASLKAMASIYWTMRSHSLAHKEAVEKADDIAKRSSGRLGAVGVQVENEFGFDEHTDTDIQLDFLTNYVSALGSLSLLAACAVIVFLASPSDSMPGDSSGAIWVILVVCYVTMMIALGSAQKVMKCCTSLVSSNDENVAKVAKGIDNSGLI